MSSQRGCSGDHLGWARGLRPPLRAPVPPSGASGQLPHGWWRAGQGRSGPAVSPGMGGSPGSSHQHCQHPRGLLPQRCWGPCPGRPPGRAGEAHRPGLPAGVRVLSPLRLCPGLSWGASGHAPGPAQAVHPSPQGGVRLAVAVLVLGILQARHWSGLPFPSPIHEVKSESEVAQSCPTLSDPMDCSPSGFSIHGIFQARVLEWVAIAFSRLPVQETQETHF